MINDPTGLKLNVWHDSFLISYLIFGLTKGVLLDTFIEHGIIRNIIERGELDD
jgi:hypothetical protein